MTKPNNSRLPSTEASISHCQFVSRSELAKMSFKRLHADFERLHLQKSEIRAIDAVAAKIRDFVLTVSVCKDTPLLEEGKLCADMLNSLVVMRRRLKGCCDGH